MIFAYGPEVCQEKSFTQGNYMIPPGDRWTFEEAAQTSDPALAKFYASLNDSDRWWLKTQQHIDIHGDRRRAPMDPVQRWSPSWIPFRELT
jgi:hypothetical protein